MTIREAIESQIPHLSRKFVIPSNVSDDQDEANFNRAVDYADSVLHHVLTKVPGEYSQLEVHDEIVDFLTYG